MKSALLSIALLASWLTSGSANAIDFNMAPLEFSNRAACADLAARPARSIFLMIDGFNAGKAAYAQGMLAQKTHPAEDPKRWAERAVNEFRLWTTQISVEILQLLVDGKLPLLSPDSAFPAQFREAVGKCTGKGELLSCTAVNELLSEMWSRAHMSDPRWRELGVSQKDFFPADLRRTAALGCHLVKKFSAFQSHLRAQEPNPVVLDDIGIATTSPEDVLDSCFVPDKKNDPRFAVIQLDVADIGPEKNWDRVGFAFWHSFKLFLSWAWRYAPEYQVEFGAFRPLFSSLAFEDSVMPMPNGCRSIELPRCDSAGLASDAMRAAKFLGQTHAALMEVPPKPIDVLFTGRFQAVNSDILAFFKAGNADAWYRDFKDKLSGLRFEMIMKLNASLDKLKVITTLVSPDELSRAIDKLLKDPHADKTETYLACMEYTLAKNQLFQDIHDEIQNLTKTKELESVLLADSGKDLERFIKYYERVSDEMQSFCHTLESAHQTLSGGPELLKSLNEWAFDLLRPTERGSYDPQCVKTPGNPSCPQIEGEKFLLAKKVGTDEELTICRTPLECARTVLQSLVSIISVRRYARAFLPIGDLMKSPDLLNPYAMPTSCKLYDPWLKNRNAWKMFVSDLGSSVLFGASCGAFKLRMLNPSHEKAISYREIFDDNQSAYDVTTKKTKTQYLAGTDLGFLGALSCGFAVENAMPQGAKYVPDYFADLAVSTCLGHDKTSYDVQAITVSSNGVATTKEDNSTSRKCFQCAIGVSHVPAALCAATPVVGQAAGAGIALFQGMLRLFSNLDDPDNIPRLKKVDVDQISKSFEDHGSTLKRCHKGKKATPYCRKEGT